MASVSSLDGDLRKLRLEKYTPAAANEARSWIENTLGERLPPGDLLEALKDGVALCKLVNRALPPPGVRFKQSAMPFVQMENISLFLRACQAPPLNLQQHDMFLTVDLYESKDPAQVLQCIGAFSRAAHAVNPAAFPTAIGPRGGARGGGGGVLSPQSTGPVTPTGLRGRGISNASNGSSVYNNRPALTATQTGDSGSGSGSGRWSPTKTSQSPTSVSTWSKRDQEGATSPAWNIAQYGYMGGASQGNLGISFGGRRQITSAGPHVPSLADKERLRKEKEAEEARQRQQMEEEMERRRRAEMEAEEERARLEEERRWEEETRRLRAEEKRKAEEEKRRWEEEERQWKITEEKRRQEEAEAEARLAEERQRSRSNNNKGASDPRLRGQFLSQYQAEQHTAPSQEVDHYSKRVQELEKELELARQREQEYERERQERARKTGDAKSRARSRSRPRPAEGAPSRQDSWSRDEREILRTQRSRRQMQETVEEEPVAVPPRVQPSLPSRPLPDPTAAAPPPPPRVSSHQTGGEIAPPKVRSHRTGEAPPKVTAHTTGGGRPLPDPTAYASASAASIPVVAAPPPTVPAPPQNASRTDRYLASHPAPQQAPPPSTYARELGATAEQDAEDRRRAQAQQKTKAGGWASKSLLEREMEMERQRQREWEEAQKETAQRAAQGGGGDGNGNGNGVDGIGGGVGGRWDVSQWAGYTGGDSQNRGAQGIGAGRRQIVGPRPLPGSGHR